MCVTAWIAHTSSGLRSTAASPCVLGRPRSRRSPRARRSMPCTKPGAGSAGSTRSVRPARSRRLAASPRKKSSWCPMSSARRSAGQRPAARRAPERRRASRPRPTPDRVEMRGLAGVQLERGKCLGGLARAGQVDRVGRAQREVSGQRVSHRELRFLGDERGRDVDDVRVVPEVPVDCQVVLVNPVSARHWVAIGVGAAFAMSGVEAIPGCKVSACPSRPLASRLAWCQWPRAQTRPAPRRPRHRGQRLRRGRRQSRRPARVRADPPGRRAGAHRRRTPRARDPGAVTAPRSTAAARPAFRAPRSSSCAIERSSVQSTEYSPDRRHHGSSHR